MIMRSTSALNPVAGGLPVPASARGVNDSSPKKFTRGDNADARCRTNCPSLNPRGPSDFLSGKVHVAEARQLERRVLGAGDVGAGRALV